MLRVAVRGIQYACAALIVDRMNEVARCYRENKAEIELTEYHEAFLQWLIAHGVQHVRLG